MEDSRESALGTARRFSIPDFLWLVKNTFCTSILLALGVVAWEFFETQRIWNVIDANEGHVDLAPGSLTIGDSYGSNDLICGRPIFRYQIVKVSVGFRSEGDDVDFSQPLRPGERHPLAVLEHLPNLEEVSVFSARISKEGLACLARCHRLSTLYLEAGEFSAEQMEALATSRSLHQLDLVGPSPHRPILTGSAVAALRALPKLQSLSIRHAEIDDPGMLELSKLRGLRDLSLFWVTFDQSALRHLADLPNLEDLSLRLPDMTRATYESVGRLTGLKSLALGIGTVWPDGIDDPVIDQEFAELSRLTKLESLWLESKKLSDAAIDTLLCFSNLETLSVDCTEMTDDGAIRLANGLNLSRLHLFSPEFHDPERICEQINRPKMYFSYPLWHKTGLFVMSTPPSGGCCR